MMRTSPARADPLGPNGFARFPRSAEHGFTPLRRSAEHGFTLVELLIVLTILGLMSAVVVIAMPGERAELRREADAFAARASAAQDRAVLASRAVSVRIDAGGYAFERRSGGAWQPVAAYAWRERTRIQPDGLRVTFDPTGTSDRARLLLLRGDEQLAVDIAGDGSVHVQRP